MIIQAGLVARALEGRNARSIFVGIRERNNHQEDLSIDGRML
jgi:hypothetical protein